MNPDQEYEIDLRDLLNRVFVQWRLILRGAIIIALLAGGYRLVTGLISLSDPETRIQTLSKYDSAVLDRQAEGELLKQQIDNVEAESEYQLEYNEKSLLMTINPRNEWAGSLVFYVNADDPTGEAFSEQNTDLTRRLVSVYNDYLRSGEFYSAILDQTDIVDEFRFLKEIMTYKGNNSSAQEKDESADQKNNGSSSVTVTLIERNHESGKKDNIGSPTFTVTCIGKSKEDVTEILGLAKDILFEKTEAFQETIGKHQIGILSESVYATTDPDLARKQNDNLLRFDEYAARIRELNLEMEKWEKTPGPKANLGMGYTVKQAVKYALIGGIAGCVIMAGYFVSAYLFSPAVKTDTDMKVLGITVLGSLQWKCGEKKETMFERWIDKKIIIPVFKRGLTQGLSGRKENLPGKVQEQLLVNNLNSVLKNKGLPKAAILTFMDDETSQKIVKQLDSVDKKVPYVYAGNLLTDPEAVKKVEDSPEVILLAKRYYTRIDDIQKTQSLLTACGKSILGAVIVEDAE